MKHRYTVTSFEPIISSGSKTVMLKSKIFDKLKKEYLKLEFPTRKSAKRMAKELNLFKHKGE